MCPSGLKGQVIFNGHINSSFSTSQGSRQGRILAPFLYKVYINQLLMELCQLDIGITLFNHSLSAPSFADDMTLLACFPSCLNIMIQLACKYSCNWKYQFSYGKTGVVAFGECAVTHSKNMKVCQWKVGPYHMYEKSEYVNLCVFKNYCGSFDKNIDENITKARKKQECYYLLMNMLICVCLKTTVDLLIKILMRTSLRPEKSRNAIIC